MLKAKDSTVDKVNLPFFYQLGTQINTLTKTVPIPQNWLDILLAAWRVRESINGLLGWGGRLSVCRTSGQALVKAIEAVVEMWNSAKPEDRSKSDSPINKQIQNVIEKAKTFETVLCEELAMVSAYSVSRKGAYSTPDLIDTAENVFPVSVLETLNGEIIREVREAGKCLAFDIPTASGFHMLRATEGMLHEYYLVVCKPKKKDKLENWGAYIAALYKLTQDESHISDETKNHIKKVLALLQQIKDEDRNQIMHLEVVLNDDQAFVLFEITKGAIMAMAEKLPIIIKVKTQSTKA